MARGAAVAGRHQFEDSTGSVRDARVVTFLSTLLGGLLLDQGSKWLAMSHLARPQSASPATGFGLSLTHNPGLLAGVGGAPPLLVQAFTAALLGAAALLAGSLLSSSRSRPRQLFALALLLAGGLGNLLDRITTGGVVDFLQVGCLTVNAADLLLLAGGLLYDDPFHRFQSDPNWMRPVTQAPIADLGVAWASSAETPIAFRPANIGSAPAPGAVARGSRFRRVERGASRRPAIR